MYAHHDIPTGRWELIGATSLVTCKDALEEFARNTGSDQVSASLYAFDQAAWELAKEFEDIGCPFDYPCKLIQRGPRGALVVSNA